MAKGREWLRVEGRPVLTLSVLALAAIVLLGTVLRLEAIDKSMPYPRHVDEPNITEPAGAMLKTGDFNPHYFIYPSLPIYMIAAAYTAGFFSAATHSELGSTEEIGNVGFPFYTQPRVVKPAFVMIVLLSMVTFVAVGWVGYRLAQRGAGSPAAALFLGPFVLFFSSEFFHYSHAYLQVNIFGDTFFWLLIAYLFWRLETPGFLEKSVIPGILAGLVLSCKYNFLWIVFPPLLAIWFYGKVRRPAKSIVLLVVTMTAFFLTSPYCLLDFSTFLNHFAATTSVYHKGFFENTTEPGWPHFWLYVREIIADFGTASLGLAIIGLVAAFRACWRRTLIIIIFPLLVMAHMSLPRAHFLRNALSGFPTYALFVGLGLSICWLGICGVLARWPKISPRYRPWLAAGLIAVLSLMILPIRNVAIWRSLPVDSRNLMTSWIIDNVPKTATLVVPAELSMDVRPLAKAGYQVESFRLIPLGFHGALAQIADLKDPYLLLPSFNSSHWAPFLITKNRNLAENLNLLVRYHDSKKTIGWFPVSVSLPSVMTGNPKISAGPLKLDANERTRLAGSRLLGAASFAGKNSQLMGDQLFIFAQGRQTSEEIALAPGKLRVHLTCNGTMVAGQPAQLRISFGNRPIGLVSCGEQLGDQTADFVLRHPTKGAFSVELINDAIEKLPDGSLRDRNAWLSSLLFYSIDSGAKKARPPGTKASPKPDRAQRKAARQPR